jgi:hypothetical protein
MESQQVLEWMAMGEAKGWTDSIIEILAARFGPGTPANLEAAIRSTTNLEQLQKWLDLAVTADSLDAFRQTAGL